MDLAGRVYGPAIMLGVVPITVSDPCQFLLDRCRASDGVRRVKARDAIT
jgi:hypothetical protein